MKENEIINSLKNIPTSILLQIQKEIFKIIKARRNNINSVRELP